MSQVRDREAILLGALGSTRASTIRKRIREWRKARAFCLAVTGQPWPQSVSVLLDYLHERRLEPCARTVPAAILASLAFIEKAGAVRKGERFSDMEVLINTVHQLTGDLETRAPPRRKAPMLPAVLIGATELALSDPTLPLYLHGFAFYKLLKLWTSSRSSDLCGLDPNSLKLSEHGLSGVLDRTKTGPGKKIRILPIFVSNRVNPAWLADGWALWADSAMMNFARDYFLPLSRWTMTLGRVV